MLVGSKYSEIKPSGAYVYRHRRATDNSVFYVGKGSRDRAWQITKACGRSNYWLNTARKHGVIVEIVKQGMTDCCALTLEKLLISHHKMVGDVIVNLTNGGDGLLGVSRSGEVYRSDGSSFASCADAARVISLEGKYPLANSSKIYNSASGIGRSMYGYAWSFDCVPNPPKGRKRDRRDWYGKTVFCSNGMKFESILDAQDWVKENIGYSCIGPNIAACAHNRRPHAGGLNWSFNGVPEEPVVKRIRCPASKSDQTTSP